MTKKQAKRLAEALTEKFFIRSGLFKEATTASTDDIAALLLSVPDPDAEELAAWREVFGEQPNHERKPDGSCWEACVACRFHAALARAKEAQR